MQLEKIRIRNFRSVQNFDFALHPTCRVLVGINEGGKTNILHALRLLSERYQPAKDDPREIGHDEEPNQPAFVTFEFRLLDYELDQIVEIIESAILAKDTAASLVSKVNSRVSLRTFVSATLSKIEYRVDIKTGERAFTLPSFKAWLSAETGRDKFRISARWKAISKDCPEDAVITLDDGKTETLASLAFVEHEAFPSIPWKYKSVATLAGLYKIIVDEFLADSELWIPDVVFWEFSPDLLLPDRQNIQEFRTNPDCCKPLKHMFALAGFDDANAAIGVALEKSQGMTNLLERIANITTEHIKGIWKEYWKEYKNPRFQLIDKGDDIEIGIRERYNVYAIKRRSDGFKRFITFLLLISAMDRTGELVDTLILIDEPDMSLHPKGVEHLRKELIKLSRKNWVVFTTHSIFMIDKNKIGRHLIVKKDNEITNLEEVSSSNIQDEEVIYNAVGYSIFETLKRKNIIFEGYKDKVLFSTALRSAKAKQFAKDFESVGRCHAYGAKDISRVANVLELGSRQCFILSDADKTAKQHQRRYDGYGEWYCYDDLDANIGAVTGEDFITNSAIKKAYDSVVDSYPGFPPFEDKCVIQDANKLKQIESFLKNASMPSTDIKNLITDLKDRIFEDLKPQQIEMKYFDLISKLRDKMSTSA